jgi:CubicO group peptidase (beta-lactamase class C family)
MFEPNEEVSTKLILTLMAQGKIPGIAMCRVINGIPTKPITLGLADRSLDIPITTDTVFEAASLSKSVFGTLVTILASGGEFNLDLRFGDIEGIDDILPYKQLAGHKVREDLTARIILKHLTGLPNNDTVPLEFQFPPGEQFKYSGYAYFLLQKVLEQVIGKKRGQVVTLEQLAQEKIFGPLGMHHTHFYRPGNLSIAAHHNSDMMTSLTLPTGKDEPMQSAPSTLHTTASDFALFMAFCMDEKNKAIIQPMFDFDENHTMTKDQQAVEKGVSPEDLKIISWGLGWGLLKKQEGIIAFQWGDNGDSKALVAMNLTTRTGIVYFANSWNGLSIAQELIATTIKDFNPALNYLFRKYDYVDHRQRGWEKVSAVENYVKYELNNSPELQQKLRENIAATVEKINEQTHQSDNSSQKTNRQYTGLETFMRMMLEAPLQPAKEQAPEKAQPLIELSRVWEKRTQSLTPPRVVGNKHIQSPKKDPQHDQDKKAKF